MNLSRRNTLFVLALTMLSACAHAPAPPAADEPVVDPALLKLASFKDGEYVLRHEHNDGPYGLRDKLVLARFPVQKRNGLCTTPVREVGFPTEAGRPPIEMASRRVVFREPATSGCAAKARGDFFYGDEASLPSLLAAQDYLAANGFGEVKPARGCLGRLPEGFEASRARLEVVSAVPGGLRMEFHPSDDDLTWLLVLSFRVGEAGPVRESASVICTNF
jgi:hypothetical protein